VTERETGVNRGGKKIGLAFFGGCAMQNPVPMNELPEEIRAAALKAAAMVEQDFINPPDLSTLAREAGMSPIHLSRIFGVVNGMTIPAMVRRLRMQEAAKLLRATDMLVTEIAGKVGYRSPAAFDRAFMREMGKSPSEHRGVKKSHDLGIELPPRTGSGRIKE